MKVFAGFHRSSEPTVDDQRTLSANIERKTLTCCVFGNLEHMTTACTVGTILTRHDYTLDVHAKFLHIRRFIQCIVANIGLQRKSIIVITIDIQYMPGIIYRVVQKSKLLMIIKLLRKLTTNRRNFWHMYIIGNLHWTLYC